MALADNSEKQNEPLPAGNLDCQTSEAKRRDPLRLEIETSPHQQT